jgi:hypothetical protein
MVSCVPNRQEDVVNRRLPYRLAAAAGLWASSFGFAGEPARHTIDPTPAAAVQADQALADAVAQRLGQTAHLSGYQVEIAVVNGTVELSGTVATAAQHDEVIRIARGVPKVKLVSDRVAVQAAVQPVANPGVLNPPVPLGAPPAPMGGMPMGGMPLGDMPMGGPPGFLPGGPAIDPAPLNGPGMAAKVDLNPPNMPPYAWPTYAPYNNYSRVGYPEEYPHAAFPFIGPFYPFPKVPLGFRAIKLEWEDGHWWYGRTATRRDWWTVRYW